MGETVRFEKSYSHCPRELSAKSDWGRSVAEFRSQSVLRSNGWYYLLTWADLLATKVYSKPLHCAWFWLVHSPGTETLGLLWHFPASLEKLLRCSNLVERRSWLPTEDVESCL